VWVCSRSFAATADYSNPALGHGCPSLVSVVCCQVEVSVMGQLVILLSAAFLEPYLETSTMRRPRPTSTAEPRRRRGKRGGGVHQGRQLMALKNVQRMLM